MSGDDPAEAAILFDMDGVILQGGRTDDVVYERAADRVLSELGVEATETHRRRLSEHGYDEVEAACLDLALDPERFWERREARACDIANARIEAGERSLYPDVDSVYDFGDATTLALVSNNRHGTATFVAEHFGLPFDVARGRDPTVDGLARKKPAPDYLDATMDTLGRSEGIYVGDREKDMIAAGRAGLEGAFLRRSHNQDVPLPADATYELESLSDLSSVAP